MKRGIRTHYDNLKVSRDAPGEVVRAAYYALMRKHHPDRNAQDPDAVRIAKLINLAYEILSDPAQRRLHDEWILEQEKPDEEPQFGGDFSLDQTIFDPRNTATDRQTAPQSESPRWRPPPPSTREKYEPITFPPGRPMGIYAVGRMLRDHWRWWLLIIWLIAVVVVARND